MLHTKGNILIRAELTNKEKYKFESGEEIAIEKGFNFNLREDLSSIAEVVSAENIPTGALCLHHHNSTHDTFKVFESEEKNIFSITEESVYCYRVGGGEWYPTPTFLITLRLFEPYKGFLVMPDELIKKRLYIVKGKIGKEDVSGKVAVVTPYSDYEIIWHQDGKPTSLIRTREREILLIDNALTERVKNNEVKLGYEIKDAKYLK